ncbi:MAG: hypothetical protein QOI95_3094 [Acidimicrobiaceae bacterium]|jgi:predicted amino acid-binding ACT domain protein
MALRRAGFTWSSPELFVDTVEESAAITIFREAVIAARERQARESGKEMRIDELLALYEPDAALPATEAVDHRGFVRELRAFNREAGLNARLNFASSFAVSLVCPDRLGVLAKLTRHLADLGCSVRAATTAVVAGQVAIMLMVSGPNRLQQLQIENAVSDSRASCMTRRQEHAPLLRSKRRIFDNQIGLGLIH